MRRGHRRPLFTTTDHYGDEWSVYIERPTEHGWPLLLGRPASASRSGDQVILTTDLVEYLMGLQYERGTIRLPIGGTALKRLRRALGLNIYDDMRQWWEDHADELAGMTETTFAAKHGYCLSRVSQANKALFGRRLRDAGWWREEPVTSMLMGETPAAIVADELEISVGATRRLRCVLRASRSMFSSDPSTS